MEMWLVKPQRIYYACQKLKNNKLNFWSLSHKRRSICTSLVLCRRPRSLGINHSTHPQRSLRASPCWSPLVLNWTLILHYASLSCREVAHQDGLIIQGHRWGVVFTVTEYWLVWPVCNDSFGGGVSRRFKMPFFVMSGSLMHTPVDIIN